MSKGKIWAFFESLKHGVRFENSNGTPYTKITDALAKNEQTGAAETFRPEKIVWFVRGETI